MTKLKTLRRQLAVLRRARQLARWAGALSAFIVTVLWLLAAVFVIDFTFALFQIDLTVIQRLIVLCFAGAGVVAGFVWFSVPWLGVKETREDMALLVEQQQEISSDLIAALQFESPQAPTWGSPELEAAVVDYVSRTGRGLHVFKGFPVDQLVRRCLLMTVTVGCLIALLLAFPAHAKVFFHRLGLGAQHYPTATIIDQVVVNHVPLLERTGNDTAPAASKVAEGKPLEFIVQCSGDLPDAGTVLVTGIGNGSEREVTIDLSRLTIQQRRDRLIDAADRIRSAGENPEVDIQGPWTQEVTTLVRFDAPQAIPPLLAAKEDRAKLPQAIVAVEQCLKSWPGKAEETAMYVGALGRMVEPAVFQVYLGDAWTNPAVIDMIPLPAIELDISVTPPAYARATAGRFERTARHLAVLESSQVDIAIQCTNGKRLTEAWLVAQSPDESRTFQFERTDEGTQHWKLRNADWFQSLQRELRFQIQVTDDDGMHLESPLSGYIRLKTDRPPAGSLYTVHRVTVPTVKPVLEFEIQDDYGIAEVLLHVAVERQTMGTEAVEAHPPVSVPFVWLPAERLARGAVVEFNGSLLIVESVEESKTGPAIFQFTSTADNGRSVPFELKMGQKLKTLFPLPKGTLPCRGEQLLDLSSYNLVKGDRVRLELEVVDYRGDLPSESAKSDPLVLEVSDEIGVVAAITERDERSEKQLTDSILLEIGIGESP